MGSSPYAAIPLASRHPDELYIVGSLKNMSFSPLRLDPRHYEYPSLHIYLSAAAVLAGRTAGLLHLTSNREYYVDHPDALGRIFVAIRVLAAFMGSLTVVWLYILGRLLGRPWVGVLAGLTLATTPAWVRDSHFMMVNVPMGFWLSGVAVCSVMICRRGEGLTWYILGGVMCGLAASTKYPGILGLAMPVVAHACGERVSASRWRDHARPLIAGGVAATVFVVTSPFVLLHWTVFLAQTARTSGSLRTLQTGNLLAWATSVGIPLAVLCVCSIAWFVIRAVRDRDPIAWICLAWLASTLFIPIVSDSTFVRFMVPALPVMAYMAAGGVAAVWSSARMAPWRHVLLAGIVATYGLTVYYAVRVSSVMKAPSVSQRAAEWIDTHVRPGSQIRIVPFNHHSSIIDTSRYTVEDVSRMDPRDPPELIVPAVEPLASGDYSIVGACSYARVVFENYPVPNWLAPVAWYTDDWAYTFKRQVVWQKRTGPGDCGRKS
jgi:4-amino-4-deoxy-L-arabinose transferase-like glycosyltransferase